MVETKANYIHKRLKNIRKLSKKNYVEGKNKFIPKDINKIVKNYGGNKTTFIHKRLKQNCQKLWWNPKNNLYL